jgi:ketosteroid isomerase-like protein
MYHYIVEQKLRQAFRQLNAGDYNSILRQFAPRFEHFFSGQHALAGTRHTPSANEAWYRRLAVLFPDLRFEVKNVVVSGWPWNTRATIEWVDHFTLRDGQRVSNAGVHVFRLRWGRVVGLHIYCDTQKLATVCGLLAQQGVNDAAAMPIVD